jgi:hypothetical protein
MTEAKGKKLTRDLQQCQTAHETVGGENELLAKELCDGLVHEKEPWQIRKELFNLKGEVKNFDEREDQETKFESTLARPTVPVPPLPPKKRMRLIPSDN